LDRSTTTIKTQWGDIRVKVAIGTEHPKFHLEYEDVALLAREHQVPYDVIAQAVYQQLLK
jgi:uncharacterized protein (DUF111 family)